MQTIVVTLDIKKLDNIDLGLHDRIAERAAEVSGGAILDGGNGYFSPSGVGVWLKAENAAEGAELLIKLFQSEPLLGNDLAGVAEIHISEEEHALLFDCTRVYPRE